MQRSDRRTYTGDFQGTLNGQLTNIRGEINNWRAEPARRREVEQAVRKTYIEQNLPLSTDAIAILAKQYAEANAIEVAVTTLAANSGHLRYPTNNAIPFSVLRGLVAAAGLAENITNQTLEAVAASLEKLEKNFSRRDAEAAKIFDERKKLIDVLIADSTKRLEATEAEIRTTWTDKIEASIAKINATDAAFTKQMQLEAPVSYWRTQSTDQKSAATFHLTVLIGFIVLFGAVAFASLQKYLPVLLERTISDAPFVLCRCSHDYCPSYDRHFLDRTSSCATLPERTPLICRRQRAGRDGPDIFGSPEGRQVG